MSCWVVPAVAAEMWGTTIARVLEQARSGQVPTKTEYGFMLVDVAPHSPRYDSLTKRMLPPQTFVEVAVGPAKPPVRMPDPQSLLAEEIEANEDGDLPWRTTRQAVSKTRLRPGMARPMPAQSQAA